MIIDSNLLTDTRVTDSYVIGKAVKDTDMLKKGELVTAFDGVRTCLEYIQEYMPEPQKDKSSSGRGSGHGGFTFGSYDQAMDIFLNDPSRVVTYDEGEMKPTDFHERGNDVDYDVTGDFIDVGRVLEGIPEHFGSMHNGNARNRRVRLIVNIGQSHHMSPEDINHRSERVIRLVDMLENANVRTEFIAAYSAGTSHTEITVKRFDESLVLSDVAIVTNTDFPRRMMFRVTEYSDTFESGYGVSPRLNEGVKSFESTYNDELTVFIEGNMKMSDIDNKFDKLEKDLEKELSEHIPTTQLMHIKSDPPNPFDTFRFVVGF